MRGILRIAQRQVIGYSRPESIQSALGHAQEKRDASHQGQTYLLYRYGFTDGIEHRPARHFIST